MSAPASASAMASASPMPRVAPVINAVVSRQLVYGRQLDSDLTSAPLQ